MIGLFDSGLGGLTVVRRVQALLPQHDLLFLADQAHVPYGGRSVEDLRHLLEQNLAWLDSAGVQAISMACNTSCAIARQGGWPPTRAIVLDLIESAAIAVRDAGFACMGVVATAATVRSGAYTAAISRLLPEAQVTEIPAPALVPLVEAGEIHGRRAAREVALICNALPPGLDAVILACTHYPLLDEHFANTLGNQVARVDPAFEQAGRTAALVSARSIAPGTGRVRYVTTGANLEAFTASVTAFTGELAPECAQISFS